MYSMAILTVKQKEVMNELESLAQILELEVVESVDFPTLMIRVNYEGISTSITKKGEEFLATELLPCVEMTYVGGSMFKYRVDI